MEASPLEPGFVIIALIRVETQFLIEAAEAPPWPQRSVYRLKDQLHCV